MTDPRTSADIANFRRIIHEHPEIAEDEKLLADMLDAETDIPEAINRLVLSAGEDEAMANARRALANEYIRSARGMDDRAERKRTAICQIMAAIGIRSVKVVAGNVIHMRGRMTNKVTDANDLPQGYYREIVTRKPDYSAINSAVADGEQIPGVERVMGNDFIYVRK